MRSLIRNGVYLDWIQKRIVQAQYFKQWDNYETYLDKSIFLADINNEVKEDFTNGLKSEVKNTNRKTAPNQEYANRLSSLNKLVLARYLPINKDFKKMK